MQRSLPCAFTKAISTFQRDSIDSLQLIYIGSRSTKASSSQVQLRPYSSIPASIQWTPVKENQEPAREWHLEDDKRRAKRALELDTFFSSKTPNAPEVPNADNAALLEHCNRAIVLSRTSSNLRTFDGVRHELQKASQLFHQIVKAHRDYGVEPDMTYEIFLLRSSWLQVVRTILALVRGEAVRICSKIMIDYLKWEGALLQSSLRIKDGTEKVALLPATQVSSPKAKELLMEQYFHGPFVQDAAPVLHELFSFMTVANQSAVERAVKARMVPSIDRRYERNTRLVGVDLWKCISAIDGSHWKKPLSPEWLRLCERTEYKSGQELVASCMLMHAEGLYGDSRMCSIARIDQSLSVWHEGLSLCKGGCEFYLRKLMTQLLKSIHRAGLELSLATNTSEDMIEKAKDYFESLLRLAEVLHHTFKQAKEDCLYIRKQDLEKALRLVLASESMFRQMSKRYSAENRHTMNQIVSRTSKLSNDWILTWLQGTKTKKMPRFASISTYNRILERFLHMRIPSDVVRSLTTTLLQKLESDQMLPLPDEKTISLLIRLAKQTNQPEMAETAVLLAKSRAQAKEDTIKTLEDATTSAQMRSSADIRSVPSKAKPIVSLIDDALKRGDIDRLQSLLKSATLRQPPAADSLTLVDVPPQHNAGLIREIVFHLYPSLDLRRRRTARRQGENTASRVREESINSTAFEPRVLSAAFDQVVAAGLTGLGERVWRLIKRCHVRNIKSPLWRKIDIAVYSILMRLYRNEVRLGSRIIRQRRAQRIHSPGSRPHTRNSLRQRLDRRQMDALPRGWGYILSGPGASRLQSHEKPNRVVLARAIAKTEYLEMKQKCLQGTADKPDGKFWQIFLSIFRKGGKLTQEFEIASEEDARFLASVKEDMHVSDRHLYTTSATHQGL